MNWNAILNKEQRFAIGLTSGAASLGLQASLVRIKGTGERVAVKHLHTLSRRYETGFRNRLLAPRMDARELSMLSFELGDLFAEAAGELLKYARSQDVRVDFIASDGHTMSHVPPRNVNKGIGTHQVGEPAVIAERTGLPVVSDFAARDMAAGGQGAPLLSYACARLFHRWDRVTVCLDLGGTVSMTLVPRDLDDMLAFDAGPGTITIDGAMRYLTGGTKEYDKGGKAAASGVVVDEFLEYLLDHPYFNRVPPKSTGWAEFGPEVYLRDSLAARSDKSFEDLVATCTTAVAYLIVRAYNRFIRPRHEVDRFILMGGGCHNATLVELIKKGLSDLTFRTTEDYHLPGDAMGGIGVAVLGNETLCGTPGNFPQATGARHPVILGKITPGR